MEVFIMEKNKEVFSRFKCKGEIYLNEILQTDKELQILADQEERSVAAVFGEICEYLKFLNEKNQVRMLDEMYVSKKFAIFFTLTKEVMIKKNSGYQLGEIKKWVIKKYGVPNNYLKHFEFLSKSNFLNQEVSRFFKAWGENPVDYEWKKRSTSGYQSIRASHY